MCVIKGRGEWRTEELNWFEAGEIVLYGWCIEIEGEKRLLENKRLYLALFGKRCRAVESPLLDWHTQRVTSKNLRLYDDNVRSINCKFVYFWFQHILIFT